MNDWKAVAAGLKRDIPEADLERIAPALDTLLAAFRPLHELLTEEVEPAVVFHPEEGEA